MQVFSTSYPTPTSQELITNFVKVIKPNNILEIGTQQGGSASLLCKGLTATGFLLTVDLFEEIYKKPPCLPTHANKEIAIQTISAFHFDCNFQVQTGNAWDGFLKMPSPDLIHIDICNHFDNIKDILKHASCCVSKAMIIEGGKKNRWHRKYDYKPWHPLLSKEWFSKYWNYITIPINNHNAITLCTRT